MNTAARILEQSHAIQGRLSGLLLGHRSLGMMLLMVFVLFSAFAVVYERNIYRNTLAEYQGMQQSEHELALQAKQLMLEQSTWATQSRIQQYAEKELVMHTPNHQTTVTVTL